MSMTLYMALQMVGIFFAYFGVTIILPLIVFRRVLKGKSITNQILFSFLIGNSYIITIVQILQLLKISYTITLILATIAPAYVVWVKLNKVPVEEAVTSVGISIKRMAEKHLRTKTFVLRVFIIARKKCREYGKKILKIIGKNFADIFLQIALFVILIWCYGNGIIHTYGYSASDIPVHNYWINAMGDNHIFVAGVYPHGYHCMIYYLHSVFGFETYVLLSLFAFVQVVCIHFALLYFLKLCCKNGFVPYIGAIMFAAGNYFMAITYSRFASTLPQEFGMIFIFPCIYYGFEFFKLRYEEVKQGQGKKESWHSLFGFAMGFGITLSAHFYNTIVAGFFCVAMALGYLFLLLRKQYFKNVVVTCFVSVLVAILPMGIAFATGTPLEGSLYWARSVIVGSEESEEQEETLETIPESNLSDETNVQDQGANIEGKPEHSLNTGNQNQENSTIQNSPVVERTLEDRVRVLLETIQRKIITMNNSMKDCVWSDNPQERSNLFWLAVIVLLVEGVLCIIFRKTCYGAMLISIAFYLLIMLVVLSAGALEILMLMDPARACIYFSYAIPLLLTMPLDGAIYLGTVCGRFKKVGTCIAIIGLALFCVQMKTTNSIRTAFKAGGFETNEAVTCLTNILHNEQDFMWTICSANDEFRMSEEHGYHYEVITFLRQMENPGKETIVTMPTPKVFFFIEKIPLDYAVAYENSGQKISKEGAERTLSYSSDLAPYQGENRWITMSRMYYWAQEFQKLYPNEMHVYLETENFVCYVVEQNPYNLYNFAIDYGFNSRE